ncbi:histidine-type phosphatase [Sphingomonas sp. Tas61C01]|uniref:histidine-type phosphatase n=1 Tax=Sphingomonas sp. Tas61C01 TaxID=3458297 RepID=UPI00403EBE84
MSAAICRIAAVGVWLLVGAAAPAPSVYVVERAVLVMRHGIRAPLEGEVPTGTRTAAAWPRWPVAESRITPHGARALELVAAEDRQLLGARGLHVAASCQSLALSIRSNSSDRSIASGEAYARGFAPGCAIPIEHQALGTADPLFEPLRARATRFDARAAILSINAETGGMERLAARYRSALTLLDRILGCGAPGTECLPMQAASVTPAVDGREIVLSGPIRIASGIAQVLLLEQLEGMPSRDVGWGRASPADLKRLGALHAALFAVLTRPAYMAAHQSAAMGRAVLQALDGSGPAFRVFMGHDTNVTALAATLQVNLAAAGYAINDVPPGGGLLFEKVRNRTTGATYVRVSYRTQSPAALRSLSPATSVNAVKVLGSVWTLLPSEAFKKKLEARLAALEPAS